MLSVSHQSTGVISGVILRPSPRSLFTLMHHEIIMTLRQAYVWVTSLLFFVIIVCLFPFALGADASLLNQSAAGVIWIAALLAILLSISHIFRSDLDEGHLEQLLLSEHPLALIALCKIASHWITNCLPLVLISPLLGFMLNLDAYQQVALFITLIIGTPALSLLGGIGAALMVGARGNGLLLPVLIMPLYIPILIFGTGTIIAAGAHQPLAGYYAVMGALTLFSLAFAPLFAGLALRIGTGH